MLNKTWPPQRAAAENRTQRLATQSMIDKVSTRVTHKGGCHCGRVKYEVDAPAVLEAQECNCSMCKRSGYLHLIVPRSYFRLLQGEQDLSSYSFNTHTAKHLFCKVCGIKSFYVPRSNPDGYSVNVRCLDPATIEKVNVTPFDGENWEKEAQSLKHLSNEN